MLTFTIVFLLSRLSLKSQCFPVSLPDRKSCAGVTLLISLRLIPSPVMLAALILRDSRFSQECYGRCSWNMTLSLGVAIFLKDHSAYIFRVKQFLFLKAGRPSKTAVTIYQSIWRLTFQNTRIFSGTDMRISNLAR